jgi:hypothetical protein
LFIQLDFFPDTPVTYVLKQPSDPPEIPTIPTALEEASTQAREIINDLREIDFKGLVDHANEALVTIRTLVEDPALHAALDQLPGTVKNLNGAVDTANALLVRINHQVDPISSELQTADRRAAGDDQRREDGQHRHDSSSPVAARLRSARRPPGRRPLRRRVAPARRLHRAQSERPPLRSIATQETP